MPLTCTPVMVLLIANPLRLIVLNGGGQAVEPAIIIDVITTMVIRGIQHISNGVIINNRIKFACAVHMLLNY